MSAEYGSISGRLVMVIAGQAVDIGLVKVPMMRGGWCRSRRTSTPTGRSGCRPSCPRASRRGRGPGRGSRRGCATAGGRRCPAPAGRARLCDGGGRMTRYDAQWIDVLDAEMWAAVRRMSAANARARRAAAFFLGAWRAGR